LEEREAIKNLGAFVRRLIQDGVCDKAAFREWRKQNKEVMEHYFDYIQFYGSGIEIQPITALVSVFFHPEEPLVGLNYTPVAHNTLYRFPAGWTMPLRLCRGIIFDHEGNLAAKPFGKFFNVGENEETKELPDMPFCATEKKDGHLGIIFEFKGKLFATTRGSFESRSALIASEMLKDCIERKKWDSKFLADVTTLVEIIHPETKVHVEYGKKSRFILIGAYDRETLYDFDYEDLCKLGKLLGLKVTERWQGNSLQELKELMKDLSVENKEGYVVRFQNGLRIKFKFATYINMMVKERLGYAYLMKRIVAGNLQKMIENLPEEVYAEAEAMIKKIRLVQSTAFKNKSEKEKRQYLYELVDPEKSTSYYRSICRSFLRHV
jgi:hypothetical protein